MTEALEKKIDDILMRTEKALEKVEAFQHSKVKLPRAELDLLKGFEDSRDFMNEIVVKTASDRAQLVKVLGGDGLQLARARAIYDATIKLGLSPMNVKDQRIQSFSKSLDVVRGILDDLGLKLKEATAKAAEEIQAIEEEAKEEEKTVVSDIAEMKLDLSAAPTKQEAEAWTKLIEEDLAEKIVKTKTPDECNALKAEVDAAEKGIWMIWMVHRAFLNDPTLTVFDFTVTKMPNGDMEPRVAPKLAVAMETNPYIEKLLLPSANLRDTEAAVLAVSLTKNATLKVLNIDSNPLRQMELESIARSIGMNNCLEELRCNNTAKGRQILAAFLASLESNDRLCKIGHEITDPAYRDKINKLLTRNMDNARKRRVAAKREAEAKAAEAAAKEKGN